MEKFTLTLLLLATVLFSSCKKEELNPFTLGVDVQSSFDQDLVKISIDGEDLINTTLQTNYSLGVCLVDGQVTTTKNEGMHEIMVTVNNAISITESFEMTDDRYIGVNYNQQTTQISLVYADDRFIYD